MCNKALPYFCTIDPDITPPPTHPVPTCPVCQNVTTFACTTTPKPSPTPRQFLHR